MHANGEKEQASCLEDWGKQGHGIVGKIEFHDFELVREAQLEVKVFKKVENPKLSKTILI